MHTLIPLDFGGKPIVAFVSGTVQWFNLYDMLDALGIKDWDEEDSERLGEENWAIADIVEPEIRETIVVVNLAGLFRLLSYSNPEVAKQCMSWLSVIALPCMARPGMAVLAR